MKKGYNNPSDIPQQEGQDQARKLYRYISETARRLDDARGCAQVVSDLFTPGLLAQRSKLRENCERLIFLDPILYGHKGEELLWKRIYYDVVSTSKRLKKQEYSLDDVAHLQCHINAGIGYYHHFITRLQLDFDLRLQGIVDFPPVQHKNNKNFNEKLNEWAGSSVHRCLIYLGDLNRYKLEIYPNWDHGLAVRYYLQASNFKPEIGMPHNQLGTLASCLNSSLDAVYYYMRCLCCPHIFEGAENNLLRLLEKNSLSIKNNNQLEPNPSEHIQRLISKFLLMIDIIYFEKNSMDLHSLCHEILIDLQGCLSYSKPVDNSGDSPIYVETVSEPSYLSSDSVFKMIIICLMCISKLQKSDSPQISAVKAFLLAVYSQLIQNVIQHIQESVLNLSLPSLCFNKNNGKLKRKNRIKLRRRLQHNSDDSDDLSESDVSLSSSSQSEDVEHSEEDDCGRSSEESDVEDKTLQENGTTATTKADSIKKVKKLDPMDLLEIVADEGLLQGIKILCDWLTSNILVLKECGNSSQILLKKIVQLLNLINIELSSRKLKNLKISAELIRTDGTKIPLPEDIVLKGLTILKERQENIDWNYLNNIIVDSKEEALFRVNKLVSFGHFLTGIKDTGISFEKKKKNFVLEEIILAEPEHVTTENEEHQNHTKSKNSDSISRGKLMKHMGQLWLAAEIQDLESRVKNRTSFSPYLVLDVEALIHYQHLVKQFVSARKFIVLVPFAVLSALDELKRETIKAREAIRWLEAQFHHGNRFLRAQRPQERSPIPLIKYPKKKDKETYTFIQIIECCYFLTQPQKGSTNAVTLLTGNPAALQPSGTREISCLGLAQSAGVNLELITGFHQKWKKSVKENR